MKLEWANCKYWILESQRCCIFLSTQNGCKKIVFVESTPMAQQCISHRRTSSFRREPVYEFSPQVSGRVCYAFGGKFRNL